MLLNQLDLIVRDVPSAADFFHEVVGMELRVKEERFAELRSGPVTIMFSPDAMVPTQEAAGVILHFQVEDVQEAVERAASKGATVLLAPTRTDWGWESAMISGPENIIVDFYRQI